MNTIRLYKFKDSITRKLPFLNKESDLDLLNDPVQTNSMDVEVVAEYVISISNDFIYEDLSYKDLVRLCSSAKETIEHYFVVTNNNLDLI